MVPMPPGPVPKRDSQRRRTDPNRDPLRSAPGAQPFDPPAGNKKWHPVARRWFDSLAASGQVVFWEPSDWAVAEILAETMSRELRPKFVGVGVDEEGKPTPILHELPIPGAALGAILRGMVDLVVTEGARRRARIELAPHGPRDGRADNGGKVSWIDQARRKSG
jgi:hypothetical protein